MLLRGGSSKGAYFLSEDLPPDGATRDDLLLGIMGSPDARQIDGLGGAHPLTSKVAVVGASDEPDVDVDYLFLQVGVDEPMVSDRQNCGNLLAGVGPFAIERGLVAVDDTAEEVCVRIRMLNTGANAVAVVPVHDGRPVYEGDTAISGVPGTAAAIRLEFEDLAGGSTALLPTGAPVDVIDGVPCTLIDNGMPVAVMRADELGVSGHESCSELEADAELRRRLEAIRLEAGSRMGLGDVRDATVPKLTMVAPPAGAGQLATRTFIPHRCHEAIGVLGAVSVATAALLPGTPAAEVATPGPPGLVTLEHPTGLFECAVSVTAAGDAPVVERAGIIRTARKLMDGYAFAR